jgi:hypothetical protein
MTTSSSTKTTSGRLQLEARGSKFTMLLSKDERSKLYELASADGVPASVYLRTMIRTEYSETLLGRKPKAKKGREV